MTTSPTTRRGRRPTVRGRGGLCALAALGFLAAILPAPSAFAYVRYLSKSGCPYSWRTRTIELVAYPTGLTDDVTVDDFTRAVSGALSAWSKTDPALAGCTDLDLQLGVKLLSDTPPDAQFDHLNNVMIRNVWGCMPGASGYSECRDPNALAVTSVFATKWGEIVDADVEVNAVNFIWANLDTAPAGSGKQDLQNALTHEIGHFIGLDHTCYGDPTRARPNDQNNQPIPDCFDVSPEDPIFATTMFASAAPGDISKRSLEPDDQAAVCAIYPANAPDGAECPAPTNSGGCGIGGIGLQADFLPPAASRTDWRNWVGAGTAVLSLAAVAGMRSLRRRRRR